MIPGLGGMNPKKMQGMMKQLGINQEDIDATKVTIETTSGSIEINNPSVQKITMQGQESFQITGEISESSTPSITAEDIKMVMGKTGKSEAESKTALEKTNDIADAIMELSS